MIWTGIWGTISYTSVRNFILSNINRNTTVYAKGLEKSAWIENMLMNKVCVNLIGQTLTFRKLEEHFPGTGRCEKHFMTCTLHNVFSIYKYLRFGIQQIE